MNLKNKIELALKNLKAGKLIIVTDDENRENEGDLTGLVEFLTPDSINFMISEGKGLLCTPISQAIALKHHLSLMPKHRSDGTNFTISIDSENVTTGISALERYQTMKELLQSQKVSLRTPGHVFPLIAHSQGLSKRRGHTEAAIDLARLAQAKSVTAIVEIVAQDGNMLRGKELNKFAEKHQLLMISIEEIIAYIKNYYPQLWNQNSQLEKLDNIIFSQESQIPTNKGLFKIRAAKNLIDNKEYSIIFQGRWEELNNSVARIHSTCVTSETFGSLRCDCAQQLDFALEKIKQAKKGFLLYTPDEGRGIGIFEKVNAYHLQDQGLDTYEANLKLERKADERSFDNEWQIIKKMGVVELQLITNNPDKIAILENHNIKVKRIKSWNQNKFNEKYLTTKKNKFNHIS